ncbi:hypothetical protein DY000_02021181 [Brassica cretica]|uniref:Uncharacterized protein n=1 Tax=Brassica cretica TaxID=69181 RepID=A0ABQ7E8M2_BRACR|nr:hypothetical protein DY000_02021181 [Brassica cretica]
MDTAQGGDLVIQLDPTEVLPSFVLNILPVSSHLIIPSIPTMFSHRIVLIRPSVRFHPITQTVPHVLSTVSTHRRPERSSDYNHNLEVELIDPNHLYPNKFNIIRLIAEPESTWEEKNPKMAADSPLWTFWSLKLSEDLSHASTHFGHVDHLAGHVERPAEHFLFLGEVTPSKHSLFRWTYASYQATFRNPSFVGLVRHIKQQLKSGVGREILLAEEKSSLGVERPTLIRPHRRPNRRCKEQFKSSRDEADQKKRFLQFDVQEFCDNFEKEMMKALRDVSKIQKKAQPHVHL